MRFHKEPAEDFACSESSFFQDYKKNSYRRYSSPAVQHRSTQETLQRICSAFLAAVDSFRSNVPEDFATAEIPGLMKSLPAFYFDTARYVIIYYIL